MKTIFTNDWADELEGFTHLCCLSVSSITDIFIQYASTLSAISNEENPLEA